MIVIVMMIKIVMMISDYRDTDESSDDHVGNYDFGNTHNDDEATNMVYMQYK
jgi:hypothetical protein